MGGKDSRQRVRRLCILIPNDITSTEQIPQTLIFVYGRDEANELAQWLRTLLHAGFQSRAKEVIRAFSSPLDDISKTLTVDLLRSMGCQIAVCTDAFGLGMNIANIPRVVQWKLNSRLGIDSLYQRIGRGGRDTTDQALALIFVTSTNLSGDAVTLTKARKAKKIQPSGTTTTNTSIEEETAEADELDFKMPVMQDSWPRIEKVLPLLYVGPSRQQMEER